MKPIALLLALLLAAPALADDKDDAKTQLISEHHLKIAALESMIDDMTEKRQRTGTFMLIGGLALTLGGFLWYSEISDTESSLPDDADDEFGRLKVASLSIVAGGIVIGGSGISFMTR